MFKKFVNWIRQVIDRMVKTSTIENKINIKPTMSDYMSQAIERWFTMYSSKSYWLQNNNQSLGLPQAIAEELSRQVTLEMQVNINEKSASDKEVSTKEVKTATMASFLAKQLEPVLSKIRVEMEYCCVGGGLVLKPYCDGDRICVDYVKANEFIPLAFNGRKEITSAAFIEEKREGSKKFTRLEIHTLTENDYVVQNKAYLSYFEDDIGNECPLDMVDEWKSLQPETHIENVKDPLFGYVAIPKGNTIDPNSPLGVSVYANAENLIRDADQQYQRFLWEYEGGELAIDASVDAFDTDDGGEPVLPSGKERLFRNNSLDSATTSGGDLFKIFSPQLRDSSYWNGLNKILQRIEDKCGLARGTFSDVTSDAKTATEVRTTKQRSAATVTDIQMALQSALDNLIYAISVYAQLYKLAPAGEYDVAYRWDDSIVVDSEAERIRDMQEVTNGLMLAWEYRKKWYGEDEATAKKRVKELEGADDVDPDDDDDGDGDSEKNIEKQEE